MGIVTFKMNKSDFVGWTAALRSGEYKQGKGALKIVDKITSEESYCCLGVCQMVLAGEVEPNAVISAEFASAHNMLDLHSAKFNPFVECTNYSDMIDIVNTKELDGIRYVSIVHLNDCGIPFDQIADILEQHVEFN